VRRGGIVRLLRPCYNRGMDRQAKLQAALDQFMAVLVSEYRPRKVILFGSLATGEVAEWSDIDLVIVKDTPKRFLDRLKEVALLCNAPVGVDYLVHTPREFDDLKAEDNPFFRDEILQKGRVLYER